MSDKGEKHKETQAIWSEGVLRYPVPKWLLFLVYCGTVRVFFHCLRSFFFLRQKSVDVPA